MTNKIAKTFFIETKTVFVTLVFLFFALNITFRILAQSSQSGASKVKIVMLGNSMVKNADWRSLMGRDDVYNASVSDFTSKQLSWVLTHSVIKYKPQICFIYSGLEDILLKVPQDQVITNYMMICDSLRNNNIEPVINSTLYLVNNEKANRQVKDLNVRLKNYCEASGTGYIDINRVLCNENRLKSYYSTDGMNLTDGAYRIWATELNAYLNKAKDTSEVTTSIDFQELATERIHRILSHSPEKVNIAMLGNSITEMAGDWNILLSRDDVRNSGQGGYVTGQMLWIIDTCVVQAYPKACFILAGINDITLKIPVETIFENYKTIIRILHTNQITPIVQSTLYQRNSPGSNVKVRMLNDRLQTYCLENNIRYIDLNQHLSDENGLVKEYTTDGTHLTTEGYAVWAKVLKSFIKQNKLNFKE